MTLSNFISKLNWRLMVVHFVAYWFLFEAFEYFAICYDYRFIYDFSNQHHFSRHITNDDFRRMNVNDWKRILNDNMIINLMPLISFLITFGLSLFISIRKKWYWVNPVFIFLFVLSLKVLWVRLKIEITPWTFLRFVFRAPGYLFKGSVWHFIINGTVMLIIALSLFFWKRVNKFIDGNKAPIKPFLITDSSPDTPLA